MQISPGTIACTCHYYTQVSYTIEELAVLTAGSLVESNMLGLPYMSGSISRI